MVNSKINFIAKKYFWIITFALVFQSAAASDRNEQNYTSNTPTWASDQLELRALIKQQIYAIMKWQDSDGAIFSHLSQYKWDDEVEIFYNWMIYYQLTGDEKVYNSVKAAALNYLQRSAHMLDHGYFKEPYYDTEHTLEGLIILASLAYMKPSDREVIRALEDIVEHVGNWVPGYASWFDPNTRHLKSVRPGTQKIDIDCPAAVDWVFNLQFAKMALAAYYATGNERYLNWVGEYNSGWIASIEKNEHENGYYVIPSEVNPVTGEIGSCSGNWYQAAFEPGWGWSEKGNNANRDMRGPFLDYYKLTRESKYLDCIKKQMLTLFRNGSPNEPAHYFDGIQWITGTDKVTAYMSIQSSLWSPETDDVLDNYLLAWYHFIPSPFPEMRYWYFRKNSDLQVINDIQSHAIRSANRALQEIQSLTQLPGEPDEFPKASGNWSLSLVPFGGITALRGEMPWTEVLYFKDDQTLGLEEGVAALVDQADDDSKIFWLYNSNSEDRFVTVQANFNPAFINRVIVDKNQVRGFDATRARIRVPANQTVLVELGIGVQDTIPPNMPQNLRQVLTTENLIRLAWDLPLPAQDGDQARSFKIIRDGVEVGQQSELIFTDSMLTELTSFRYQVYAIDKSNNTSLTPAHGTFSTLADLTPPALLSVITINASTVQVTFNEPVETQSALNSANYSITPVLFIQEVKIVNQNAIWLLTALHSEDSPYLLRVTGVADNSKSKNYINNPQSMTYSHANQLKVDQISRTNYYLKPHVLGDPIYLDRQYRSTLIPESLQNLNWIMTANDHKELTGDNFLSFRVNKRIMIYIAYDQSQVTLPNWLSTWEKTTQIIKTDDTDFICFKKEWAPGIVHLGANYGNNSNSMYLILLDHQNDKTSPAAPELPKLLFLGTR